MAVLPCEQRLGGNNMFERVHKAVCVLKDEKDEQFWRIIALNLAMLVLSILASLLGSVLVAVITILVSRFAT